MKVMTFNTQHCKNFKTGEIDFPLMAKTILNAGADVVGLNEMRGAGEGAEFEAQVEILARLTGMTYYHFAPAIHVPNGGPYGNGLLSRIPILKTQTVPIPDSVYKQPGKRYETRCILKAELENGLLLLITHFGLHHSEQENAVAAVLPHIRDTQCILMGDFNVTPEDPVLAPIRAKMQDTAACFEEEKLSFPSDKPEGKIDYIFTSHDIKVLSADIPPVVASDHRPHVATVEL